MKLAFCMKGGLLEYTAKVLVESALLKSECCEFEDADYVFVFNKNLIRSDDREIIVLKESNEEDFLIRVLNSVKTMFPDLIVQPGFSNLEWFAKSWSKIESSDLISDVLLGLKEHDIDIAGISDEELISLLRKTVKFNSRVDNMLGVKLHLYVNHNKMESYYKWLRYKFLNCYMYNKIKCGNRFFTDSEVTSFYRSLASKIKYIDRILEEGNIDVIERYNEKIGETEQILFIEVASINRALNEVILKSEDYERLIVCCKSNHLALYSFWERDRIIHKIISNKNKMERMIEYIEPFSH